MQEALKWDANGHVAGNRYPLCLGTARATPSYGQVLGKAEWKAMKNPL
jgi:hypothetical protein